MNLFKHLFPDKNSNETEVVFDDFSISRKMADGKVENIKWSDLREIQLITTDKGTTLNDTFYLLIGESSGCAISTQSIGAEKLLERLKTLPGFETKKVAQATNSTGNNKYICWKRS
jgi:hypothetical protein